MKTFNPPNRILMGPGPSNVHPRVLGAMSKPTIGHLDPRFIELMNEIKEFLKYTFQTKNEVTFAVSGPGSVGMETCLVNLVKPNSKVLVCINGVFGGRMKSIVERCNAEPVIINIPWGKSIDPDLFEETLKKNKEVSLCSFVHAETSTGAKSDIKTLTEIAHKNNCLVIADTVTSLGGIPVLIDEWNIDVSYSGSQKCLSCPPGLSPVTFNEKAVEFIKKRKTQVQSWFMDLNLILSYWAGSSKRSYHHTAPVNSLYALHESLLLLKEEGIEKSWQRHKSNGEKLVSELEKIGLRPFVKEDDILPQLIAVSVPEGIDEDKVRKLLLDDYNIEIGAGLGELAGKVWRIGLMGFSSNERNIKALVNNLKKILQR